MNCREARRWMSPYLDSELEGGKTFEISEHLRECPDCAERFEQERAADAQMRRAANCCGGLPGEIWSAVQREVRRGPRRSPSLRIFGGVGLALAASVVLLLFLRGMGDPGARDTSPAPADPKSLVADSAENEAESPWIVTRLDATIPDDAERAETNEAIIRDVIEDRFRFTLPTGTKLVGGHGGFSIVSLVERPLDGGGTYSELRLTCCGRPVLLAITTPGYLDEMLRGSLGGSESVVAGNVRVTRATYAGVEVVAASRHTLEPILASIRPA